MFLMPMVSLAGLLMAPPPQQDDYIVLWHEARPAHYNSRTVYESACGVTAIRFVFRNGSEPGGNGHIQDVSIDGKPHRAIAETLEHRVARRAIERISIGMCGYDPTTPVFRGLMKLDVHGSKERGMSESFYFRIRQKQGGGWEVVLE